jgi:hypothetical protein
MHPPLNMAKLHEAMDGFHVARRKRAIFLDTNDAHAALINTAFRTLDRRSESYSLMTIGPDDELSADLPHRPLGDRDDIGQVRALHEAGVMLSAKFDAPDDLNVIRAFASGAWPIVPASGVYLELIPEPLHESCLYEASVDGLVSKLQDFWHLDRPPGHQDLIAPLIHSRDSSTACRAMDDRLAELVKR